MREAIKTLSAYDTLIDRQTVLETTPQKLQELGRPFERPASHPQYVRQLKPLILFLKANFATPIEQVIPIEECRCVVTRRKGDIGQREENAVNGNMIIRPFEN